MLDDANGQASPAAKELLKRISEGEVPSLVIVDTLNTGMVAEENSSAEVGRYFRVVRRLQAAVRTVGGTCTFVFITHTRKDGTVYRGSTALRAAADSEYEVQRANLLSEDLTQVAAMSVQCHKHKDAREPKTLDLVLYEVDLGTVEDEYAQPVRMTSLVLREAAVDESVRAVKADVKRQQQSEKEQATLTAVKKALRDAPEGWLSKTALSELVGGRKQNALEALDGLVSAGKLFAVEGARGVPTKVYAEPPKEGTGS